jgi:hypothetical protein
MAKRYILHFLAQWLHTSAFILVAYVYHKDTESILCVHMVDVFYIKNFKKIFHMYFFNFGLGITFYYNFYF